MIQTTYGTGTPTQFTDGTARQVLELGQMIHMFNRNESPLLAIYGKANRRVTPVPKFEWMEDEFFIRKSIVTPMLAADVKDGAAGNNDTGCVLVLGRQAQMEGFERGAVYTITETGSSDLHASLAAIMCVAIGSEITLGSGTATANMVQFVMIDNISSDNYTYSEIGTGVPILTGGASGVATITYVGNAQTGSLSGIKGHAATLTSLTDNDVFAVLGLTGFAEGAAVSEETRKKVRRLLNYTQIFRESYKITRTARVSKMYGPKELTRLQGRKLKKIKTDIEYAIMVNGAAVSDSSAENPKRKFQGFGVGKASLGAGAVHTFNGFDNTDMQISFSSGTMDQMDALEALLFEDQLSGGLEKDVYVSSKWLRFFNRLLRDESSTRIQVAMGTGTKLGIKVRAYEGAVGTLNLMKHPMLYGALENYALSIDSRNFDWRPLNESDLQLLIDVVKNGDDGQTDEWLIEAGPEIRNEQTHAIMKLT